MTEGYDYESFEKGYRQAVSYIQGVAENQLLCDCARKALKDAAETLLATIDTD